MTKLPQAIEAVAAVPNAQIGREAEAFDRSNLNRDFDQWGPGIGVIHTTRPNELQFVEWDFEVPALAIGHSRCAMPVQNPAQPS